MIGYANRQAALDDARYFESMARHHELKAREYRELAQRIHRVAERLPWDDPHDRGAFTTTTWQEEH